MDVKALAKSKRAHTQHHSKKPLGNRPNQKLKAPLEGNSQPGIAKNPSGRPVGEKIHRSRGGAPALPSNLDRYDEEFDSGSEDPSGDSASRYSDVILPKSKGADYSHLIAEAQSQSHSNTYLDGFPSLDDVLPGEFNQGLGSMLAVRGEGILSWIGEDNFVLEDKTTASHEASFLSLNLHALAEALTKVDLPKRIFIESDLLPPELQCAQEGSAITSTQESEEPQSRYDSEVDQRMLEQLSIDDSSEKVKIADQYFEVTSSGSSRGGQCCTYLVG
ncbi:Phosphorelay protein [Quillaja saponaria]|uniref:Phosphorelay protein n=1 Tax=Quillaja saponaria TaxID=32244 RepID=A0AAD7QHA5_QUISA|nr:Phosphorelay protein [Quillaja saponaria]